MLGSGSATFGSSPSTANLSGSGNGRYVREHNLQYIFARANALVKAQLQTKRNVSREEEEKLVKEALVQVQQEIQTKEAQLSFSNSFTIKSGPSAVILELTLNPSTLVWSAAIAYKSKAGPLNDTLQLNATQNDTLVQFLKRLAPYATSGAVQGTGRAEDPPLALVLDGKTTLKVETNDGAAYRILDDLISYLREVRQEFHTKRMFVPL